MTSREYELMHYRNLAIFYRTKKLKIFTWEESLLVAHRCELTADAIESYQKTPDLRGY
jgi:hypothetical protein